MSRIDDSLNVTVSDPSKRQDRGYSATQVIAVLDGAIQGGGGGGTTVNRTHQMATYQTYTNPAKVYYTAVATDGVTVLVPRTQVGVTLIASNYHLYGYDMPLAGYPDPFANLTDWIAVWDEGDSNNFTLAWEVVGGGTGIVVVVPPEDVGGTGIAQAHFTLTQSTSSLITLDATASTGDGYAWQIDNVPRPETTPVVTYGPLPVGVHNIKLTVTNASDGSFAIQHANYDVAWIATPLHLGAFDSVNSQVRYGANYPNLDPWTIADNLDPRGPWPEINVANQQDTANGGDGVARMVVYDDNHISLMNRVGDYDPNGYRPGLQTFENGSGGSGWSYPLAAADIDPTGNVPDGGTSGPIRFYRVEYMLPDTNPGGANAPIGYGTGQPWKYQFNFGECHPGIGGPGLWRFTPEIIVNPHRAGIAFTSRVNLVDSPTVMFDLNNIQYNTWYNYVIEYKQSLDPGTGYIRVWRDGVVVTDVPPGTDGAGRYFATTAATDAGGVYHRLGFNIQNYKGGASYDSGGVQPPDYPDIIVHHRNVRVGPSMASVMAI